ncbi:MAG: NADH-quinone oxidoreductase subunit K [bacterium]|jgi:NADH-quinone oxidoreductase subunit K
MISTQYFLVLSAILFGIGIFGVLFRRNLLSLLISVELLFNAIILSLLSFSKELQNIEGNIFAFFIFFIAILETALAISIIFALFKRQQTINIHEPHSFKY